MARVTLSAHSVVLCLCVVPFNVEMCPKGDDPITKNQELRKITFTFTSTLSTGLTGSVGVEFLGTTSFISLSSPTAASCISSLQTSTKIGRVLCSYTTTATNSHVIVVTFLDWPSITTDTNLFSNSGNPSASDFYCDTSLANAGVECTFVDTSSENIQGIVLC